MSGADSAVPRVLPNDEEAQDTLGDELGRLTGDAAFRVAEFAADAATIFEVSRDEHGTPTAVTWRYPYEGGALQLGMHDEWSQALTDPVKLASLKLNAFMALILPARGAARREDRRHRLGRSA